MKSHNIQILLINKWPRDLYHQMCFPLRSTSEAKRKFPSNSRGPLMRTYLHTNIPFRLFQFGHNRPAWTVRDLRTSKQMEMAISDTQNPRMWACFAVSSFHGQHPQHVAPILWESGTVPLVGSVYFSVFVFCTSSAQRLLLPRLQNQSTIADFNLFIKFVAAADDTNRSRCTNRLPCLGNPYRGNQPFTVFLLPP